MLLLRVLSYPFIFLSYVSNLQITLCSLLIFLSLLRVNYIHVHMYVQGIMISGQQITFLISFLACKLNLICFSLSNLGLI